MYAADEQVVFITKVHIESRSVHIGAIEDFLNYNGVMGFSAMRDASASLNSFCVF